MRHTIIVLAAVLSLGSACGPAAPPPDTAAPEQAVPQALPPADVELTPAEQRIARYIEAHEADALELLRRIVEINSGTLNAEGIRMVADVLASEFEELGFEVRWVELPDSLNRSGHLIAERTGSTGRSLLLIGHLDTVFEEDSPFQRFEWIDSATVKGPGVVDDKGGAVAMLLALQALHAEGALEDATIRVVLTGDEEKPGRPLSVAREALVEAAKQSDVALGFEGGSRDATAEYAVVARRSSSQWMLTTGGRRAHSSGVFSDEVGAGAIFEAARILDAFYDEVRGERYLTFNPGVIVGGTEIAYDDQENRGRAFGKTNVVAQKAVVHGGIRTISDEQLERARTQMRDVVARNLPRTDAAIEFEDGYPAMSPVPTNYELLSLYSGLSIALGYGPVLPFDPGKRGAADISFAAPHVEAALGGLGPYGSGSHTPDETLDAASFARTTQRAALLMNRLLHP